jgi:DNA-binding NarL/FixJ family response regulator
MVGTAEQRQKFTAYMRTTLGEERFATEWASGAVANPEFLVDMELDAPDLDHLAGADQVMQMNLTRREEEVLALLAAGLRDREIAEALFISVRTVEGHVGRVIQKLGAATRTGALATAIAHGLVSAGTP